MDKRGATVVKRRQTLRTFSFKGGKPCETEGYQSPMQGTNDRETGLEGKTTGAIRDGKAVLKNIPMEMPTSQLDV